VAEKNYDIRFFYGSESLDDAVFLEEFIDISRILPKNFSTTVVSKDTHGFVNVELLKKSIDNISEYDYMICGPPGMMKILEKQLTEAGVPADKIHYEDFSIN
jgi:ferredoxin-NADP reductase